MNRARAKSPAPPPPCPTVQGERRRSKQIQTASRQTHEGSLWGSDGLWDDKAGTPRSLCSWMGQGSLSQSVILDGDLRDDSGLSG